MGVGAGFVSRTAEADEMGGNQDAESAAPLLAYGWRIGPAPGSPWFLGARIEGMAVTDPDLAGGHLIGLGDVGVQIFRFIAEIGVGFGALGIGSFQGGDVAPAGMVQAAFGFPFRPTLRFHFLRVGGTFPVLPDRTLIQGGAFIGIGLEWTPDDEATSERLQVLE